MICLQCKKDYTEKAPNQKYCSLSCSRKYKDDNKSVIRNCDRKECSSVFYVRVNSDPKKYCSRSCSAKVSNVINPRRKLEGSCKSCGVEIASSRVYCSNHGILSSTNIIVKKCENSTCNQEFKTTYSNKKFCSTTCRPHTNGEKSLCACGGKSTNRSAFCVTCSKESKYKEKIESWLKGEWSGGSERKLSQTVRRYIMELHNYKCKVCGFDELHPDDHKTILEINHIDGNGSNHRIDNLEVLCPNHHALTSNYRGRNIGNGRSVYYIRVSK